MERKGKNRLTQLITKVMNGIKSKKEGMEFLSGRTDHVCTRKCSAVKCSRSSKSVPIRINPNSKSKTRGLFDASSRDSDVEDVQCISSSVLSDPVPSSFRHAKGDALASACRATGGTPLRVCGSLPSAAAPDAADLPAAAIRRLSLDVADWRLPGSQPRVALCAYCRRPRLPPPPNEGSQRPNPSDADASDLHDDDDDLRCDNNNNDDDEDDLEEGLPGMRCRCRSGMLPPTPSILAAPPRAKASPSTEGEGERDRGRGGEGGLSAAFVAPLTSILLRRPLSGERATTTTQTTPTTTGPLMGWLKEQRTVRVGKRE